MTGVGNSPEMRIGDSEQYQDRDRNQVQDRNEDQDRARDHDRNRVGNGDRTTQRTHRTNRWRGVGVIALVAAALGIFVARPALLLFAILGVVYAAYPAIQSPPNPALSIRRSIDPADPNPGDPVEVTVTVTNRGESLLADVRIVDGVPPMLRVIDGSPRLGTTLLPAGAVTITYTVEASQGIHQFEPLRAYCRDIAGAFETAAVVAPEQETTIECTAGITEVPLRSSNQRRNGGFETDSGGTGIEFHRTRSYAPGDPRHRIDWRHLAKTGQLSTVEYRIERDTAVVLCIDARPCAFRSASNGAAHAVSFARVAAIEIGMRLLDRGQAVGLAVAGGGATWLPPRRGDRHGDRLKATLAADTQLIPSSLEESWGIGTLGERSTGVAETGGVALKNGEQESDGLEAEFREIEQRTSGLVQVVLLSPLLDDGSVSASMALERRGTAVTVISPDVTGADSPGARLAAIQRRNRMYRLRRGGVPVVDWDPTGELGTVLDRYLTGAAGLP